MFELKFQEYSYPGTWENRATAWRAEKQVAEWSEWSSCSHNCGDGKKYRHILIKETLGGKPCEESDNLMTCNKRPCSDSDSIGARIKNLTGPPAVVQAPRPPNYDFIEDVYQDDFEYDDFPFQILQGW